MRHLVLNTNVFFAANMTRLASINGATLWLEEVSTPSTMQRGLSRRAVLPENSGMIFDFGTMGYQKMWMKDMNFSLDFIWIDDQSNVVGVRENVSPQTWPETFATERPARYVVEVNAGWIARHAVHAGDRVQW